MTVQLTVEFFQEEATITMTTFQIGQEAPPLSNRRVVLLDSVQQERKRAFDRVNQRACRYVVGLRV